MTGAMYAAISGLKTHMDKLNVISNNVANANTNGYKASRATFKESLYTSMRSGSDGTSVLGGNNPSQIGYGCSIGTIDLDMSTKNYAPTGKPLDCMINGDGFFMLGDKNPDNILVNPDGLNLGRVGNFDFIDGYLVDGQGNVVYGFLTCAPTADGTGKNATYGAYPPTGEFTWHTSTVLAPIQLPFAAPAPTGTGTDAGPNEGAALYPGAKADGSGNDYATGERVKLEGISISKTGKISGVNAATKEIVVIGYVALASPANPNGVTRTESGYYQALDGAGTVGVIAMDDVGQYLNNATAASETSPAILTGSSTKLVPNGLESSGTDIATEFSEMITAQRGYQANTRIVTVTDSMLEELVNMKR